MFETFDESALMAVATAQDEARALRHAAVGTEHLLLSVAMHDSRLLDVGVGAIREQVIALFGEGQTSSPGQMPFTPTATKALNLAVQEATHRDHASVRPAHLLLALLRTDDQAGSVLEALARSVDDVRERAELESRRPPRGRRRSFRRLFASRTRCL